MEFPENWNQLSKHERKQFKRNYYRKQQIWQSRKAQIKKYAVIALIILFTGVGGYWLVKELTKPLPGEFVASLGNKHIANLTDTHEQYNSLPPTSGSHVGGKASWGVSDSPIPDELQLHNLEDGGVVAQYNCVEAQVDCRKLIEDLSALVKQYPDKVLMAPYPRLDTQIALTAWTRVDKFNDFDPERIRKFIKAFKGIDHH